MSPSRDRRSKKNLSAKTPCAEKAPGQKNIGILGGFWDLDHRGFLLFFCFSCVFSPGGPGRKNHKKTENGGKNTKAGAQTPAQIPMVLCLSGFPKKRAFWQKGLFSTAGAGRAGEGEIFVSTPAEPLGAIFRGPSLLRRLRLLGF